MLYIHVPFCERKCSYCAFYSEGRETVSASQRAAYLKGLQMELSLRKELHEMERTFQTLFLGGGTPTSLTAEELDGLRQMLAKNAAFTEDAEKTVEANPGTLSKEKLQVLRRWGISRLSLGVQSMQNRLLTGIGRIHSEGDILHSLSLLRREGFSNINIDLMFGLPGQRPMDWQHDIRAAVQLEVPHLSLYALTLEEGTPLATSFAEGLCALPDEDSQADDYEWAADYLVKQGYEHYEISNFARPGYRCRHNQGYWNGEEYLGLGPSAVSCLKGVRTFHVSDVAEYNRQLSEGKLPFLLENTEVLTEREKISEHMMLGLRTSDGVKGELFKKKFGRSLEDIYGDFLVEYINSGYLLFVDDVLRLAPKYFFVANGILQKFIL